VVKAKDSSIPSQSAVDRQARREIERMADPLLEAYEDAKAGRGTFQGTPLRGYLAGVLSDKAQEALISEFVPRRIDARVGEKVTWTFYGGHTVSFDVPAYTPEFLVREDGSVSTNPAAWLPVGAPGALPVGPPDQPPPDVDAGRWDGSGYISSGVRGDGTFSMTFTRRGRYKYACVIHPRMVGEVVVS
jgi:plastocyanin